MKPAGGKEVHFTGILMCAKCVFNQTPECRNVLVVKGTGGDSIYYLQDKGATEEYHKNVCGGTGRYLTVSGTAFEKDGKKWLTPSKVETTVR